MSAVTILKNMCDIILHDLCSNPMISLRSFSHSLMQILYNHCSHTTFQPHSEYSGYFLRGISPALPITSPLSLYAHAQLAHYLVL